MTLKTEITEQIRDLLRQHPGGLSITAIVRQVKINRNTAGRYLENLMLSGQVEMRRFGMAKIYRLAQRVPLSAMLSISSELIMLLDSSRRVIYANEPMLAFLSLNQKDMYGKNIEFTPFATVCDDSFDLLKKKIQEGAEGKEWSGELSVRNGAVTFACRIAPAVFEEGQRGVSILLEDITERKRADDLIRQSELQFRLLAENTFDVISRHLPAGNALYVSPAITAISGFKPQEIIGRNGAEFIHPDDITLIQNAVRHMSPDAPSVTVTYRCRHKKGHYLWVESSFRAIFNEKTGEMEEIYGVTRDITDRILAEEALRDSEDRYRTLVEISPDAILLHKDGKIVYMNPAALRLIRASPYDSVIGKKVLDIIHPKYREKVRLFIQKDLNGDLTPPIELVLLRLDGTPVPVEGRGVRAMIDGSPGVQVTLRDITDRLNAEKARRESEETLRSITENSPDMILLIDLEGKILFINKPVSLSKDQVLSKSVFDFVPEKFQKDAASCFEQVRTTGRPSVYLTEYNFHDGTTQTYESTVGPVFHGKAVVALVINARDISERIKAEEAIRESEEKYRSLAEASYDLIFVISRDDRVMYVNSHAAAMLGTTPDRIIGKDRATLFSGSIGVRQALRIQEVFMTGMTVRSESPMPVGSSLHWFDHILLPIRDTQGRVSSVLGISRDITDRRVAEEALRRSEERFRLLAEYSADVISRISPDGTCQYVSPAIRMHLGYEPEEVTGVSAIEYLHPEDRGRILETIRQYSTRTSDISTDTFRLRHKDGRFILFEATIHAIRDKESGAVKEFHMISRNIGSRSGA